MKSGMQKGGTRLMGAFCAAGALLAAWGEPLAAAERKFLVILANSPKQFPGTGQPPEGLPPFSQINNQYFDKTAGNNIQSFAEYWEEISYGDVTISGTTTDWLVLPWPIQPPANNNPSQYLVLDPTDGDFFRYGTPERFRNFEAMHNIDTNGNPGNPPVDDGPFNQNRQPGGNDFVLSLQHCEDTCLFASDGWCDDGGPGASYDVCSFGTDCGDCGSRGGNPLPVWMPGQRFLDIDADGRWDGLDEAANQMDWNNDGRADLRGTWIDLDGSGEPNNASSACIYLQDSNNDRNPDCCPLGPGQIGCELYTDHDGNPGTPKIYTINCQPLTLPNPGGDQPDCNGNLIPDACDVSPLSAECRATQFDCTVTNAQDGLSICGRSLDALRISGVSGTECTQISADGTPDECQFSVLPADVSMICWTVDPATGVPSAPRTPLTACQGDPGTKGNCQTGQVCHFGCTAEIQDPLTDPCQSFPGNKVCLEIVEATPVQRCEFDDSNSNNQVDIVEPFESFLRIGDHRARDQFDDPDPGIVIDGSTLEGAQYIRDNYPGNPEKVIRQSIPRNLFGEVDPGGVLPATVTGQCVGGAPIIRVGTCNGAGVTLCSIDTDCPVVGQTCQISQANKTCDNNPSTPCTSSANCGGALCKKAVRWCKTGEHVAYTSPDRWFDVGSTKVRFDKVPVPKGTFQPPWYQQAWRDRYEAGGCGPTPCDPPTWDPTVQRALPFPSSERRYISANRGGLRGDGSGWIPATNSTVVFTTESFEDRIDRRILPEEINGIGANLVIFDGNVEHDDLPSSKYHRAGDKRFGEVTSPYNNDPWGHDIAPVPGGNGIIVAGGPYATRTHGDLNTDAGNVQNMELLTWRTGIDIHTRQPITPPPSFNNGVAWEDQYGINLHPYAGPSGANLGFRDYNLDGMLDQGEVPPAGSDNYLADTDPQFGPVPGTTTIYPWNRQRLLEDCIEVLDQIFDFDDYVDQVALDRVVAERGIQFENKPSQFREMPFDTVIPNGVLSGIVLLSAGSHAGGDFLSAPSFYPIHNEDNDDLTTSFPDPNFGTQRINWNLFVHDLVIQVDDVRSATAFQSAYSAHEYLHSWEGFPDLYDYDIYAPTPQPPINTPVGQWDIMAGSGEVPINLVHPVPILKEAPHTEWIKPVDLTTVLTPGVDSTITLPRSEFVRDNSHYFLENEDFPGERYYFWNVGAGFNQFMPGSGMLILHTDVGANPDALPNGQQNASGFNYVIVQADGLHQLESGIAPFGDPGDPWPGSANRTLFDCNTDPPSTWYNPLDQCTGLSISEVVPDGQGNVAVTFNWQPANIPAITFVDPPGGTSVAESPTVERYKASFLATDVYGGTTIRLYYIKENTNDLGKLKTAIGTNLVGQLNKVTPGRLQLSLDWNIKGLIDGTYHLFAELVPGPGAGGTERSFTDPRAGRNNAGNGTISNPVVDIAGKNARLETWSMVCTKARTVTPAAPSEWAVTSSLTQPSPADLTKPEYKAVAGTQFVSRNNAVRFLITDGTVPFAVGDTFAFVTTGLTAISEPVTITGGVITENPIARITTCIPNPGPPPTCVPTNQPSGNSPLTVNFDGRPSTDPDGQSLEYSWNFNDGSALASGAQVAHAFTGAQSFTVVLTVTNPQGRSGSASVDVALTNNAPTAVLSPLSASGPSPLTVTFSANGSTDAETPGQLTYLWDFGDGTTSPLQNPGPKTFTVATGQQTFTVKLTVTDPGGKSDSKQATILVGNSAPIPNVTFSALSGFEPLKVDFDASASTDPDNDAITLVTWNFGDGSAAATGATVSHTFNVKATDTSGTSTYNVTAVLTDARGGTANWSGVQVTVNKPGPGSSNPRAIFSINPDPPVLNQPFTADGSLSVDRPSGAVASYSWNWGDGTATSTGPRPTHTYTRPGTFTITLTVGDAETPANTGTATKIVTVAAGVTPGDQNDSPTAAFSVTPGEGEVATIFAFDARASTDPERDPLTYRWTFGDGASGDGAQVTHQYAAPGNYVVRLTVRDNHNASSDTSRTVVVAGETGNRAPIAAIGTGPRSGPAPLTLTFNGQNSFDPDNDTLTFTWEFRQGEQLIGTQPGAITARSFDAIGTYTVELIVSDGELEDRTDRLTITVTALVPDDGGEPPRPNPDEPAPLPVRPSGGSFCGIGMIMSMFWTMLGLAGLRVARGRHVRGRR